VLETSSSKSIFFCIRPKPLGQLQVLQSLDGTWLARACDDRRATASECMNPSVGDEQV
jgi:hypothetical protein